MRPTVICLTPVWNEAWILERFLGAAGVWADVIVVADQGSTDGSRQIAGEHEKVRLIDNPHAAYDEGARQRLLLEAAREIPGPRALVALDADEALSAGLCDSRGWAEAMSSPPGTVIRMPWINLLPGLERAWIPRRPVVFGLIDDGREHVGSYLHSTRLPGDPDRVAVDVDEGGVLHLQYLDESRMRAKQRWYQCFERVTHPDKRPSEVYRQYHHMDAWPPDELHAVDPRWTAGLGLEAVGSTAASAAVWHTRIIELAAEHGWPPFRRVDIWDVDWGAEGAGDTLERPTVLDRIAVRWLRFAQPRRRSATVRTISRALRLVGW